MDEFLNNEDIPDELRDELKNIKEFIILNKVSDDLLMLAVNLSEIAKIEDLPTVRSIGSVILLISGITKAGKDIGEFEEMCANFSANKLSETLKRGGKQSDFLLDEISKMEDEELKSDIFSVLGGEKTISEVKEDRENKKDSDNKS